MAAVIGLVSGGGGRHLFGRIFGHERDAALFKYYREVIEGLQKENRLYRKRLRVAEKRIVGLEEAVQRIEMGEGPPELS